MAAAPLPLRVKVATRNPALERKATGNMRWKTISWTAKSVRAKRQNRASPARTAAAASSSTACRASHTL